MKYRNISLFQRESRITKSLRKQSRCERTGTATSTPELFNTHLFTKITLILHQNSFYLTPDLDLVSIIFPSTKFFQIPQTHLAIYFPTPEKSPYDLMAILLRPFCPYRYFHHSFRIKFLFAFFSHPTFCLLEKICPSNKDSG